jgi:hypothetical protein
VAAVAGKKVFVMNGKRVLAGDARARVAGAFASVCARDGKKDWGRVEAAVPNQIWQTDMTKIWAGPAVGWAYLVCVIDCCTREIVGWNLSHRCRTEDALAAVEQAVLARLPEGSRAARVTLTTDNGTQFTSTRFIETLKPAGHHASANGVSSPGRQQLHRTVPSQPEGRGSLDGGISQRGQEARESIAFRPAPIVSHGSTDHIFQSALIDSVALVEINRSPSIPFQAVVEELVRIWKACALSKGHFYLILVSVGHAD